METTTHGSLRGMNNCSGKKDEERYSRFAAQWLEAGRRLLEERGLPTHSLLVISSCADDSDALRAVLRQVVDSVTQVVGDPTAAGVRQIQRHMGEILSRDSWRSIHSHHQLGTEDFFTNHQTPLNAEFRRSSIDLDSSS